MQAFLARRSLAAAVVIAGIFAGCKKNDSQAGVANPPGPPPSNAPSASASSLAVAPGAAQPAAAPATAAGNPGQAVFGRTCITCHQVNGQGVPNTYPPLAGSPYANGDKNRMIRIVLNGLQGPITVEGKSYNNVMPPWKTLGDDDLAAVITYARTSFGNHGGAVTVQDDAAQRRATASRSTPLTAADIR